MSRPSDLRRSLQDALELLDGEERVGLQAIALELWKDVLTAEREHLEKAVRVTCRSCAKTHIYDIPLPVPDLTTRMKGLDILMNQALGKPTEKREVVVDVTARTLSELGSLSSSELAAIAASSELPEMPLPGEWRREQFSRDVVDGEFVELGA